MVSFFAFEFCGPFVSSVENQIPSASLNLRNKKKIAWRSAFLVDMFCKFGQNIAVILYACLHTLLSVIESLIKVDESMLIYLIGGVYILSLPGSWSAFCSWINFILHVTKVSAYRFEQMIEIIQDSKSGREVVGSFA